MPLFLTSSICIIHLIFTFINFCWLLLSTLITHLGIFVELLSSLTSIGPSQYLVLKRWVIQCDECWLSAYSMLGSVFRAMVVTENLTALVAAFTELTVPCGGQIMELALIELCVESWDERAWVAIREYEWVGGKGYLLCVCKMNNLAK